MNKDKELSENDKETEVKEDSTKETEVETKEVKEVKEPEGGCCGGCI